MKLSGVGGIFKRSNRRECTGFGKRKNDLSPAVALSSALFNSSFEDERKPNKPPTPTSPFQARLRLEAARSRLDVVAHHSHQRRRVSCCT